jgi:predicted neuraminidase
MSAGGSSHRGTSAIITGLRRSFWPRAVGILLALALNAWPFFESRARPSGFETPARALATNAASFFSEDVVNPDSPHPMSHVPSMCQLPDGRLVATWYAGSREGAGDVAIYMSTKRPGDTRWSPPRAIVTRASASRDLNRYVRKVGNAVIFADGAGRLLLLYVTVSIGGWSGSSLNLTTSNDGGSTWTRGQRLTLSPFFNLAELVKNAPAALVYGQWAVPIYHELIGTFPEVLWLEETADGVRATKSRVSAGWFGYQPALTPLSPNSALAVLRNDDSEKALSAARTEDGGATWSEPRALNLPNPDAGLDALRLSDGRLILAFNDSKTGRENLRLALSTDEGQTWTRIATFAEEPGEDFSYPFLMQASNGDVHLLYAWKRSAIRHVVFNIAWLDGWISRRWPR